MIYIDPLIKNLERIPQPEGRGKYIRLDQNENPDGIPQWLFDEVYSKVTPEFLSIYPEETKLTQKYADFFGLQLENVTLTCGSVVGMGYIIKVFGEPKKTLLCVSPSFGMYGVYAESVGMNVKTLSYENDHTFKIGKILDAIDENTGIVALVNPNMPMGNVYTESEIVSVVEKASKYNALVIIDEAYYYFYDKSSLELVKKYDNVVILRTFSKMLSIPALRLGVIIGSKEIVHAINNYKPHYTVNSLALLFGEAIIDNHDKVVKELTKKFNEGKEWFLSALKENGYDIIPSEGCFICISPKYKSTEYIFEKLKEKGILILLGKGALQGFLRVTIWGKKYMQILWTHSSKSMLLTNDKRANGMKEIFIDELKTLELDILQSVHDFCIKNDINYSICGGTLIGALRHKGFIPWDDDIDIIMPRADYEKFKLLFNEQKDSVFKFIDCFNNRQYFQPFGKVVNTKTKLIETYSRPIDDMGVYIDVFPIDGIPAGEKNRECFWRKITKLKNLNTVIYEKNIAGESSIKHFIRLVLFYMLRPLPANIIAKRISRFAQKVDFNASETVASSIFGYGRDEETVKSAYDSYIDVDFEGKKFKAMVGYDVFLRNIYGDYMQLPPEEKRVLKHDFKAFWR